MGLTVYARQSLVSRPNYLITQSLLSALLRLPTLNTVPPICVHRPAPPAAPHACCVGMALTPLDCT